MNNSLTGTRTSLAILTLSTLITSPKGGTCRLKYFRKLAFSRAALMQMYRTMNAKNRYTIDQSHSPYAYPECEANKQAVKLPTL